MCFIGESEELKKLKSKIRKIAKSNASVLIYGETGTGKELVAKSIHNCSLRKGNEFVAVNCGAIPESLIESLLFGYEGGAFSGATKTGKPGLLEIANNGTLFLDEIGDMPYNLQTKMLRTLQNFKIRRVGSHNTLQLDIRIISATNKHLREEVDKRTFREDLLYRLNVISLYVPPLRQRKEDIPLLVDYFLKHYESIYHTEYKIDPVLLKKLTEYDWPGNVRELKNFVEYGVSVSDSYLALDLYEEKFGHPLKKRIDSFYAVTKKDRQREQVEKILELTKKYGNSVSAKKSIAKELGISLATLYRIMKNNS